MLIGTPTTQRMRLILEMRHLEVAPGLQALQVLEKKSLHRAFFRV